MYGYFGVIISVSLNKAVRRADGRRAGLYKSILGNSKKVVIIDGVGDPSVVSIVGVSNVDVALSLHFYLRLNLPSRFLTLPGTFLFAPEDSGDDCSGVA